MATDDFEAKRRLTFGQVEGLEPLPRQLNKADMPSKLRARLWKLFEQVLDEYCQKTSMGFDFLTDHGRYVIRDYLIDVKGEFGDNLPREFIKVRAVIRKVFSDGDHIEVFNFVQYMIRRYNGRIKVRATTNIILEEELCAYRLVGGDTLVALASDEEATTIRTALSVTSEHGAKGAHAHIRNSIDALNNNDFSGSVRESIGAVESLAKVLANEPKEELSKALSRLEQSANIHGGMKTAFKSLYGYASDEKGIRHSLLFKDKADVDEADALFMLGSCSAFLSYLISRANDAGISVDSDT